MKYIIILLLAISIIYSCQKQNRTAIEFNFTKTEFGALQPYNFASKIKTFSPQLAAWEFSYQNDIHALLEMWDKESIAKQPLDEAQIDSFSFFKNINAIEYILEKAKDNQIVIINEAHHMPQHRVFTTQLISDLRKIGFNHLGLEAFNNSSEKPNSILKTKGYPTHISGYLTREPQFGNLIRSALKSDIKIFGYESNNHISKTEREIKQAENIKSYLDKYPNEKILIHCGFDHLYEGDYGGEWGKTMAEFLKEMTGINPLTINQVPYSERSKKKFENPYYQLTDVDEPSVFMGPNENIFREQKNKAYYDIAVFHPRTQKGNRPKWLKYGDRKEVHFSFEQNEIKCPCLVFAYKEGEEIGEAIPYDIQETIDKKVTLILDNSNFNLIIWNEEFKAIQTKLMNEK